MRSRSGSALRSLILTPASPVTPQSPALRAETPPLPAAAATTATTDAAPTIQQAQQPQQLQASAQPQPGAEPARIVLADLGIGRAPPKDAVAAAAVDITSPTGGTPPSTAPVAIDGGRRSCYGRHAGHITRPPLSLAQAGPWYRRHGRYLLNADYTTAIAAAGEATYNSSRRTAGTEQPSQPSPQQSPRPHLCMHHKRTSSSSSQIRSPASPR